MKKELKTSLILVLFILYGSIANLYRSYECVNNFEVSESKIETTNTETTDVSSLESSVPLFGIVSIKSSIPVYNRTSSSFSLEKYPFTLNHLVVYSKTTEKFLFSIFSQYNFYSKNILIRLQRTDIIFPFHYFW